MRKILEDLLKSSDALSCVWGDIPEEFTENLINKIIQAFKDEGFSGS